MPDAIWTVSRPPSRLIPGHPIVPGFDIIHSLSTRHQWFTRVRLLGPHLTRVSLPFPSTLTTRALYPRSLRRFGTCSCKPAPRGLPSSLAQRRTPNRSLGCAFMAHTGSRILTQRERRMQRFKSAASAQRFLATHAAVYNTFNVQRHLISRRTLRQFRSAAMSKWETAVAAT